jgi:hypothetical protein
MILCKGWHPPGCHLMGEKEKMMIVHCLFEQSGTFKNEFKKLGYEAYDYDMRMLLITD